MKVTALFVRADSIYKTLPEVDAWDAQRDALRWPGGTAIVAHPPCRAWGRMRWAAKPREGERELAIRAVEMVRTWGGVLEHPKASRLWSVMPLPLPGAVDVWGGYTLEVDQFHFGHSCQKATWLYVCHVPRDLVPAQPWREGGPSKVVSSSLFRKGDPRWKPHCTKEEREATPPDFARWLVTIARSARVGRRSA